MKNIAFPLLMIAIGFAFTSIAAPSIWTDYKLEKMELAHSDVYEVTDYECRSKLFIMNNCTVSTREILGKSRKYFDYYIFGSMSNTSAYVLSAPETGQITTNIGVQYIQNRILTIVGWFSFFLFFSLYWIYKQMVQKKLLNQTNTEDVQP